MDIHQIAAQNGFEVKAFDPKTALKVGALTGAALTALTAVVVRYAARKGLERSASFLSQYVESEEFKKPINDQIHRAAAKHIESIEGALVALRKKAGSLLGEILASNERLATIVKSSQKNAAEARSHLTAMLTQVLGTVRFHASKVKNPKLLADYNEAYARIEKIVEAVRKRTAHLGESIEQVLRVMALLAKARKSVKEDFHA